MPCIMIVEDDIGLSQGIALSLAQEQYQFVRCGSLAEARKCFAAHAVDLVLLDIGLPDGSGFAFCSELREHSHVPVLFLTANDAEHDEVAGFLAGGDDYITKPFKLTVLRARVEAALRRVSLMKSDCVKLKDFAFDFEALTFEKRGKPLSLSVTEQRILRLLVSRRGETISRALLQQTIWESGSFVDENTLTVAMRRLRAKLEDDPRRPVYLQTVYGEGYKWAGDENG